jgi:ribonuclease HII
VTVRDITTHDTEAAWARSSGLRWLVGMDEVGRGALAGPVGVGAVRIDAQAVTAASGEDPIPAGLRDSKQVPLTRRAALAEEIARWRPQHAVAYASPQEIDAVGITLALNLAGRRALAALAGHGPVEGVLLDGVHDWLSAPLTLDAALVFGEAAEVDIPPVTTTGMRSCGSWTRRPPVTGGRRTRATGPPPTGRRSAPAG